MDFTEAVDRACQEETLLDALSWISVWECERVIPNAHLFLNGERPRGADGQGWDTCFKFLIKEVMENYGQHQVIRKIKGLK